MVKSLRFDRKLWATDIGDKRLATAVGDIVKEKFHYILLAFIALSGFL